MLLDSFPHATVKAIDASDAMVQVAQERVETSRAWFLCADAETFATGKYDLITSNASFHWFSDLPRAMGNLRGMLNSSGTIMFSYFGPDTYRELQESLASVMGCPAKLACNSFLNAEEIKNLLVQAFRVGDVEEREYQEHFSSLQDLLSNIKLTGTRGSGSDLQITWTRGLMQRLEETYLDRFGSISATYQVYMCRAAK
jgi:malonyl-CoA O-methyltransferase